MNAVNQGEKKKESSGMGATLSQEGLPSFPDTLSRACKMTYLLINSKL